jgi:hypothetical protein
MLTTINRQLRRHRRTVRWTLAMLAVVSVALTTRTALMSAHGHGNMVRGAIRALKTTGARAAKPAPEQPTADMAREGHDHGAGEGL